LFCKTFIIQNVKWRLFQNGGTHDQPGRRINDKWLITLALSAEYSFGPRLIKSVYPPGKPEGWRTHFLLLKYLLYRISHSPDHISCTGYHTVLIISHVQDITQSLIISHVHDITQSWSYLMNRMSHSPDHISLNISCTGYHSPDHISLSAFFPEFFTKTLLILKCLSPNLKNLKQRRWTAKNRFQ